MVRDAFLSRIKTISSNAMTYRLPVEAVLVNAVCMAEETGEAVKEIRRLLGFARTQGSRKRCAQELADVIISTYVTADMLGFDLDAEVAEKLEEIKERGGL